MLSATCSVSVYVRSACETYTDFVSTLFAGIPGSGIAPVISTSFIQYHPNIGWRGCYYVLIGIQLSSFLCWFFFYHPPTFRMKHGQNASVLQYVKNFDYVGTALYTGGLLVFSKCICTKCM